MRNVEQVLLPIRSHNRSLVGAMGLLLAAVTLFGSPIAGAQQGRVAFLASPRSSHTIYPRPPLRAVNRGGPVIHLQYPAFHERRRKNAGSICVGGWSTPEAVRTFPSDGVDFEQMNALNADWAIKKALDPATQRRLGETGRLPCTNPWPSTYLETGYDYVVPDEESQPTEAAEPEAQSEPQPAIAQESAKGSEEAGAEPPIADEGQFVLVFRDGREVQAVGFARNDDHVIYITTEGTRRQVPLSDLDSEATIRLNEECGTVLQL